MGDERTCSGTRVTVMGLGLHGGGLATATWFLQHGAHVTVTDLKTRAQLRPSVTALERVARHCDGGSLRLVLGMHCTQDFRDADLIMQNPGVPRESKFLAIAHAAGIPIENEASFFLKQLNTERTPSGRARRALRVIAVTGTRGKSTTAALIAEMLRAAGRTVFLAGNMRIPMLGVLDDVRRAAQHGPVDVVLELSSWHCEALSRRTSGPDIAVLTNLYPDHLNRYRSMRSYAAAKARLVRFQDRSGVVVANGDQTIIRAIAALSPGRTVWYAQRPVRRAWSGYAMRDDMCAQFRNGRGVSIAPRGLLLAPGAHNTLNLLAAVAAARSCGIAASAIRRGMRSFRGLPGRLEVVRRAGDITYVNDTCATSPDGGIAALRALRSHAIRRTPDAERRIVLIAGGADKHLEYRQWAGEIARSVRTVIFLPGSATEKMKRALHQFTIHHSPFTIRDAQSMRSAVRAARQLAHPGDTILLSPAAASFGLFRHEFDRGDQFVREVKRHE